MVAQYVAWLPGNTGLWVYAAIAADLYQLGRRPLRFTPFEEDRSLGLRPIETIASRGILMISVGVIPLAAARVRDPRSFIPCSWCSRPRPVTANWQADTLVHQTAALQAAEQVERRTAAIQEWPFAEAILARIAAILTAVATTILARLVLTSFGL